MPSYIYFGSSMFSVKVLETLYKNNYIPSLIISQPDKPKGRGLHLQETLVSQFANKHKIPLLKPKDLACLNCIKTISAINPVFFILADYGKIIPAHLLKIPSKYALGIHPSLLPKYRGPAPIDWTILNGDTITGVTIFAMDENIDTGKIISQKELKINNFNTIFSLMDSLAELGATTLIEILKKPKDSIPFIEQDEKKASYARKLTKNDGKINWADPAEKIHNLIRATLQWPSSYTYYNNKLIKITKAQVINEKPKDLPGTIIKLDKKGFYIATGNGILLIEEVKPEGKNVMSAYAFLCGHKLNQGDLLSNDRKG